MWLASRPRLLSSCSISLLHSHYINNYNIVNPLSKNNPNYFSDPQNNKTGPPQVGGGTRNDPVKLTAKLLLTQVIYRTLYQRPHVRALHLNTALP